MSADELRARIDALSERIERYHDIDGYSDLLREERRKLREQLNAINPPTHCRHGVAYDQPCQECTAE